MCALFPILEKLEYTDIREKEYFFLKSVTPLNIFSYIKLIPFLSAR